MGEECAGCWGIPNPLSRRVIFLYCLSYLRDDIKLSKIIQFFLHHPLDCFTQTPLFSCKISTTQSGHSSGEWEIPLCDVTSPDVVPPDASSHYPPLCQLLISNRHFQPTFFKMLHIFAKVWHEGKSFDKMYPLRTGISKYLEILRLFKIITVRFRGAQRVLIFPEVFFNVGHEVWILTARAIIFCKIVCE